MLIPSHKVNIASAAGNRVKHFSSGIFYLVLAGLKVITVCRFSSDQLRRKPKINPTPMHDVFITYSSSDSDAATELAGLLRKAGFQVSLDSSSLISGGDWRPSIDKAMNNARSIVVCIGEAGLQEWQETEIESTFGTRLEDQVRWRVIPVLLAGARIEPLLILLKGFLWVDFRKSLQDDAAIAHLIAAVKRNI
jgi:hypothetical protein